MKVPRGYKNPSGAVALLTWVDPAVRDYVRVRAEQLGETTSEFVARLVRQEAAAEPPPNPDADEIRARHLRQRFAGVPAPVVKIPDQEWPQPVRVDPPRIEPKYMPISWAVQK